MGDTALEPLVLSEAERRTLENWAKRRKTAQGLALRARIVLACAEGRSNVAVAARLGASRTMVRKWRSRFLARRLDGLGDEPRQGCRAASPTPRWRRWWRKISGGAH
jgi:hypothetical protein